MQPLSAFKMTIQEFSQNIAVVKVSSRRYDVEPKTHPWIPEHESDTRSQMLGDKSVEYNEE